MSEAPANVEHGREMGHERRGPARPYWILQSRPDHLSGRVGFGSRHFGFQVKKLYLVKVVFLILDIYFYN